MKIIIFVTLIHVLVLFLFHRQHQEPREKAPSKIIVHIKELPSKLQEIKKEKKIDASQTNSESHISQTVDISPLGNLDPLPHIAPLAPHKELTVQEIQKFPPAPAVRKNIKSSTTKKESVKSKEIKKEVKVATQTKEKAKPVTKAVPGSIAVPVKKEIVKKPDEKLLKMMQEGLTKMEKIPTYINGHQTSSSSPSSQKITKLSIESAQMSSMEISYAEELTLYLKNHLHFPDKGTLKLTLTLYNSGKVGSFSIIASSSCKNKELAEKTLGSLSCPPFGSRFQEKSKEFTLLLNIQ